MSQRLLITRDSDDVADRDMYDAVLTESSFNDAKKLLFDRFFSFKGGYFLGPWKIWIRDLALYRSYEGLITSLFNYFGKDYPECVMCFFYEGELIKYPKTLELEAFLERKKGNGDSR